MKTWLTWLGLVVMAGGLWAAENFNRQPLGQPPSGWEIGITGDGVPEWTVVADAGKNRVLQQSGRAPKPSYPLCVRSQPRIKNGHVQIKFKTLTGEIDQAAGVVWRYQDANNYYICRANALENNVVVYRVEKGKRTALPLVGRPEGYGLNCPVAGRQWHTLRLKFSGAKFTVIFNGKKLFEVSDTTFSEGGRVGLWTKADSVTLFDDFSWSGR